MTRSIARTDQRLPVACARACTVLLACGALLGWAPNAAAEPEHFVLRLSSMHVSGHMHLRGESEQYAPDLGWQDDHFDFNTLNVPRLQGTLQMTRRNRLQFDYFRYRPSQYYVLDHDMTSNGVTIPAGSDGNLRGDFRLATLLYDGAVVETPSVSLGLQVGVAWGGVKGRVEATAEGMTGHAKEDRNGFAPVVGLRFATHTTDHHWRFMMQSQYVNTSWASLDSYHGDLLRANALVEYLFAGHVGLHVGYDFFRVVVDRDFGAITGGISLRFSGPFAGLSFAW